MNQQFLVLKIRRRIYDKLCNAKYISRRNEYYDFGAPSQKLLFGAISACLLVYVEMSTMSLALLVQNYCRCPFVRVCNSSRSSYSVEIFERELPLVTIELVLKSFHGILSGGPATLSLLSHLAPC